MLYRVEAEVTISVSADIEADTPEEALQAARGLGLPGLCYQCARAGTDPEDEQWCVDELDGQPVKLRIEAPHG